MKMDMKMDMKWITLLSKLLSWTRKTISQRKMAWNFAKRGEDRERITKKRTRGYGLFSVTPWFW
jgi:hypothetical protein